MRSGSTGRTCSATRPVAASGLHSPLPARSGWQGWRWPIRGATATPIWRPCSACASPPRGRSTPYRYAWFNASLLFPPDHRRAHAEAFERLARNASPQDADGIEARLEAILAFDARPLAPGLTCPTLVATAADDQLMPPWFGAELAALIPGAARLALDGGGHMLPETRADALADAVIAFLDGVA